MQTTQRKKKARSAQQMGPLVEFTAAAHEHVETAFDTTALTGTAQVQLGPFEVPAYGYLRHIDILISISAAGALGTGVLGEDFPFNIIDSVALLDVNGAPIIGPLTGYDLYVVNLFGGYVFRQDPTLQPDYSAAYTTVAFMLRIPVEIHANTGLGSLPNQNAAASYKVNLAIAPLATQLVTVGTATPNTYRVRGYAECWSQPDDFDAAQRPQALTPPRVGTTQYWSVFNRTTAAGAQTFLLPRVGNLLRNIIFIVRNGANPPASLRTTANFPDPVEIRWDARQMIVEPRYLRRAYASERYIFGAGGVPAGVFVYDFDHDTLGHGGNGTPELWWPTVQSTRLEIAGQFGAGDLRILTNDVAPAEIEPQERFVETSDTGFRPMPVGAPIVA